MDSKLRKVTDLFAFSLKAINQFPYVSLSIHSLGWFVLVMFMSFQALKDIASMMLRVNKWIECTISSVVKGRH